MEKSYLWGIDLGGTKIECAVLSASDVTQVIARERIDTEASKGYEHIISQVARLVSLFLQHPIRLKHSQLVFLF